MLQLKEKDKEDLITVKEEDLEEVEEVAEFRLVMYF
jgi:hypothetical protein